MSEQITSDGPRQRIKIYYLVINKSVLLADQD